MTGERILRAVTEKMVDKPLAIVPDGNCILPTVNSVLSHCSDNWRIFATRSL